jgi:integral membrane protein
MPSLERPFRLVALAEATSFLLLLVATYVKYGHEEEVGVQILGPVHGLLFVAYVLLAVRLAIGLGWSGRTTVLVLLGAVLPFGGFVVDRWLARRPAQLAS